MYSVSYYQISDAYMEAQIEVPDGLSTENGLTIG